MVGNDNRASAKAAALAVDGSTLSTSSALPLGAGAGFPVNELRARSAASANVAGGIVSMIAAAAEGSCGVMPPAGETVVAFQQKKITIDVAQAREALGGSAVTLAQDFHLPPGSYAAKVLVRLEGSDAIGFARSDFKVTSTTRR